MNRFQKQFGIAALAALAGFGAAGCSLDDSSSSSDKSDGHVSSRSSDRYDAENTKVPAGARKVVDEKGAVSYRAPYDGRVWVTNGEHNEVIYTARLYEGEQLSVEPKSNRISIDGQVRRKLETLEGRCRIFFDRERY